MRAAKIPIPGFQFIRHLPKSSSSSKTFIMSHAAGDDNNPEPIKALEFLRVVGKLKVRDNDLSGCVKTRTQSSHRPYHIH